MKENLLKIINNYGVLPQLKHFNSEVFELNEAIIKKETEYQFCETTIKKDRENLKHIAEEISDCFVMLKQFQYYYGITDEEIINNMQFKIKRQLERIENEKSNNIPT